MSLAQYRNAVVEYANVAKNIWSSLALNGFSPKKKDDGTLVTSADIAIEKELRARIEVDFPEHGIVGEEFGIYKPEARYFWYLDPIDGTEELAYGLPYWGTVIALHEKGVGRSGQLVGLLNHPAMDICCIGVKGEGAFCNGKRVSIVDESVALNKNEIRLILNAPVNYLRTPGGMSCFHKLVEAFPNIRIYRSCFAHTCVITSKAHVMMEVNVSPWDVAATQVIVQEAGGLYVPISIEQGASDLNLRCDNFHDLKVHSAVFGQPEAVSRCLDAVKDYIYTQPHSFLQKNE